jgi:hypothetical protein
MAELQCTKDFLCSECCICWADRSLPATVAHSFPPLAGMPGGVEACVDVLVRYVGSGHDMAMFELSYLLFLERFSAGGVGGANQSVCFLSCLSINESIRRRSLTCIS